METPETESLATTGLTSMEELEKPRLWMDANYGNRSISKILFTLECDPKEVYSQAITTDVMYNGAVSGQSSCARPDIGKA